MSAYIELCGWTQRISNEGEARWQRILRTYGAIIVRKQTVVVEARGIPMGYQSKSSMEDQIWPVGKLRNVLSSGLISGDPNVVLLELETCGGR